MGWDSYTYDRQPEDFLADIAEVMGADNEAQELAERRAGQGSING